MLEHIVIFLLQSNYFLKIVFWGIFLFIILISTHLWFHHVHLQSAGLGIHMFFGIFQQPQHPFYNSFCSFCNIFCFQRLYSLSIKKYNEEIVQIMHFCTFWKSKLNNQSQVISCYILKAKWGKKKNKTDSSVTGYLAGQIEFNLKNL